LFDFREMCGGGLVHLGAVVILRIDEAKKPARRVKAEAKLGAAAHKIQPLHMLGPVKSVTASAPHRFVHDAGPFVGANGLDGDTVPMRRGIDGNVRGILHREPRESVDEIVLTL
jgi:hypothetical protein